MADPVRDMPDAPVRPGLIGSNMGKPILVTDLNMAGVSMHAARAGETLEILTRLSVTSDEELFHQMVGSLAATLEHHASQSGAHVRLDRAGIVFLVLRPDNSGELWVDAAAMCTYSMMRRPGPIAAGSLIYEHDIADITGLWFPHVEVGPKDRILCLIREKWRFGLFFDFNPDGDLSIEDAKRALGTLFRKLRYADLYAAMAHEPTFSQLVQAGWFPFLELMNGEFKALVEWQKAGFGLEDAELELLAKFDDERLDRMFTRWMERPHLKDKEAILEPAIRAFKAKDPVSVIKNILSEIEGVMSEAFFQAKEERTHRIGKLLEFIISVAEQRAGGKDTLFFPVAFGQYLKDYTYVGFQPGDAGNAGSRHAVGHGAVAGERYTMIRALQAILTMDQLAFYI